MKKALIILALVTSAHAENQQYMTPSGTYYSQQSGSTTYVTQTSRGSGSKSIAPTVPVNVNPVTGIGQVHTSQGSYLVQRSGSTTTVIRTSKGR